jgi:hypothetical protein
MAEVKDQKELALPHWLDQLYNVTEIKDEDLYSWYEMYQYQGFNRKEVLKQLMEKVPDLRIAQQIIMICALRGPQRAALTKIGDTTIERMGIPASGMKGNKGISCQRITAATADLAAWLLKKVDAPKRLPMDLPGWLQFPSAGSITMPIEYRQQHIEFARRFSTVIGGLFNEQIYQQMVNNSYLSPKLHLFGDFAPIPQSVTVLPAPAPSFNPARGDVGPTKTLASDRVKKP